jgi:hypothetical protein
MSIEDRIARLERQNRRLRAAVLVIGLGLATAVAIGAGTLDRVFIVLDDDGKHPIQLEYHPEVGPRMYMVDRNETMRMIVGSDDTRGGAPYIEFRGPGPAFGQPGPVVKRIE